MQNTSKFYIADCSIDEIEVAPVSGQKGKFDSWALGRATLAGGELELHFNWVAEGGDSEATMFQFALSLDEEQPDFELEGAGKLSDTEQNALIQKILASTPWQAEVAECLPKNPAELAQLL